MYYLLLIMIIKKQDWVKEIRPISIQYLEIVYLGKFLGNDTTLQGNNLIRFIIK
jgi:hypothetical protein